MIQTNNEKVAVVTGYSKYIDKKIKREFDKASYDIIINKRDEEKKKRSAEYI